MLSNGTKVTVLDNFANCYGRTGIITQSIYEDCRLYYVVQLDVVNRLVLVQEDLLEKVGPKYPCLMKMSKDNLWYVVFRTSSKSGIVVDAGNSSLSIGNKYNFIDNEYWSEVKFD